jgi:mono/diheme cytochrome c family protein
MICRKSSSIAIAAALTVIAFRAAPCCSSNAVADNAAPDRDKITAGEAVYNTRCAVCHGDELVNSGQTFDLRRLKADERPRFENSVRNGKNQMPPWKGVLSDDEIDQLWHYIRAHAVQK